MHGLYDGDFAGYRLPTPDEFDTALKEAVVAIDANVLLNLYRYRPQTAQDFLKVLETLGDRLVVPHQALREFWRHRQRSPGSPDRANEEMRSAVDKAEGNLTGALATWAKQVGVEPGELSILTEKVTQFAEELTTALGSAVQEADSKSAEGDAILKQLERIMDGRVTAALTPQEFQECVVEGQRRIEALEPPGYRDAAKEEGDTPEGGAGDYLVWYQATRHAKDAGKDLLLVTADEKDDWWWRQRAEFLGPRPELSLEFGQFSGHRLFMLRPADLLARAEVLQVEVAAESAEDAERNAGDGANEVEWTQAGLRALLLRLDRVAPVQAAVLRAAASNPNGIVTREEIYQIGKFDDERMLRGFTRPYRRLTERLQSRGDVPQDVPQILVARYTDGVKASYFSTPPEVPRLFAQESSAPSERTHIELSGSQTPAAFSGTTGQIELSGSQTPTASSGATGHLELGGR